ncbi:hypothetical protein ACMAY7_10660 [Rhodobacteraceae bacterium nBUS_24]
MRHKYKLDKFISHLFDLLIPPKLYRLRERCYFSLAKNFSKIEIPWCYWSKKDYETLYVDPQDIKMEIKDGRIPRYDNTKFWERAKIFKGHPAVKQIFVECLPYSETLQYEHMMERVKKGQKAYWCRNETDVHKYFEILKSTYESMAKNGYLASYNDDNNAPSDQVYPNGILVSKGINGELYLERGGTHRLTIAQLLELNTVPVIVIREYSGRSK